MKATRLGLTAIAMLCGGVTAHPHAYVDQQALLSVGMDAVALSIRIVPSFEDGPAIFALIDGNSDGVISGDEAAVFGAGVVSRSKLEVDGRETSFRDVRATVPAIEYVTAGTGVISIEAVAPVGLRESEDHEVDFEIAYDDISHEWFVQPFFYSDLIESMSSQAVVRGVAENRVGVRFSLSAG